MPQEPGATIRVDGQLYAELRAIAEARDCTLRQAMDFWIDRKVRLAGGKPKEDIFGQPPTKVVKGVLYTERSDGNWLCGECGEIVSNKDREAHTKKHFV